jgi:N-acetylmuramoyl-L-alanine amidase
MGGYVFWNEEYQEVYINFGESFVILTIDSIFAVINEHERELDVPAMIIANPGELYGSTMVPARFVAEAFGAEVEWDEDERIVTISLHPEEPVENGGSDDSGLPGENGGSDDSGLPGENGEPNGNGDYWEWVPGTNLPAGFAPLPRMTEAAARHLIFIDIGHGGTDPGAIGDRGGPRQLFEKDINLVIGFYLRDFLREAGVNFYMSRESDISIPPAERGYRANELGATLFVSIHNNASGTNPNARGTEVLFHRKVDEYDRTEGELFGIYSEDVANRIQREMVRALGTFDRGTRNAPRLIVLNRTVMPAVVVEGAFLSNTHDLDLIWQDDYAIRYAYAVAKAIIEIMNETFR